MSRTRWLIIAVAVIPVLIGAVIVSGTLGPMGALIYCLLLLGGVNSRHLFRRDREELLHRFTKGRR